MKRNNITPDKGSEAVIYKGWWHTCNQPGCCSILSCLPGGSVWWAKNTRYSRASPPKACRWCITPGPEKSHRILWKISLVFLKNPTKPQAHMQRQKVSESNFRIRMSRDLSNHSWSLTESVNYFVFLNILLCMRSEKWNACFPNSYGIWSVREVNNQIFHRKPYLSLS